VAAPVRSFVAGSLATPFFLGLFTVNWLLGSTALVTLPGVLVGLTVVAALLSPSVDPATGLTVEAAGVPTLSLNLMSIGAALLLPLVFVYFAVLYSAFSAPIEAGESYRWATCRTR